MRPRGTGSVDIIWLVFWWQQECSIAVLMVSISAFRSLFVPSPAQTPQPRQRQCSPREKRRGSVRPHLDLDLYDTHETNGLPQIPNATLTGLATVMRGDRRSVERADLDQRSHRDHDRSTEISTIDSSARDAELGLSTESVLPHTYSKHGNAKPSRPSGRRWWKRLPQSETARTASTVRTGYWDVMSLFRTGHSESMVQSKDRSEGQL